MSGSIHTVLGDIASACTRANDGKFELKITVPGNMSAEAWVPTGVNRPTRENSGAEQQEIHQER